MLWGRKHNFLYSIYLIKIFDIGVNSFSAIGDYSRHSGRPLLSTLVDKTSCNDVIKSTVLRCQQKINTEEIADLQSLEEFKGVPKVLFTFFVFYFVKFVLILSVITWLPG